jgi:hypothetical protein
VLQLLVIANVLSSLILFTLLMEAIRPSETSVLTRAKRRRIPEYAILLLMFLVKDMYMLMPYAGLLLLHNMGINVVPFGYLSQISSHSTQ